MSVQKQLRIIIGSLAALVLIGCSAPMATPISVAPSPVIIGIVKPTPKGCLYMEFVSPSDASAYRRESGHIRAVVTPIKRVEPLQRQWTLKDFEEAIYHSDTSSSDSRYLPGVEAWEYLKQYLQPEDEIWTFGVLDTGFVIIREDKVFSIVVTDHSL